MASPDLSLSRIMHHPHATVAKATPMAAPAASDPATSSGPSFTDLFASMAAAATAAGTTAVNPTHTSACGTTASAAALTSPATDVATTDGPAGPLFGANPWLANPTGSGPGPVTNYNSIYFATPQTAQTVAQMAGGTVVAKNEFTSAPGSPFQQDQPNLMVQLPNGGLINPGLVADLYTHGWNQSFINQQVANEVASAVPASTNS